MEYVLDERESARAGTPVLRGPDGALDYRAALPDGRTVWGHVVRQWRVAYGYSQPACAEALGVCPRTVQDWERGINCPGTRRAKFLWRMIQRLPAKKKGLTW